MSEAVYSFAAEFKEKFLPFQKRASPPIAAEMQVTLSSYPPVGQVTQVTDGKISFFAILDVHNTLAQEKWEVALWSSRDGSDWVEEAFERASEESFPSSIQTLDTNVSRIYYQLNTPLEISLGQDFTLKFRKAADEPWRWVRDEQGPGDGKVIVNPGYDPRSAPKDLGHLIKDLNPALNVKSYESQCPGTWLWRIDAPVAAADGDKSAIVDIRLGVPWGNYLRWFALVRIWTPWLAPRHGRNSFHLDKDAVLCSFLSPEGKHLVLLGISGVNDVLTVFRHSESGEISIHIRNDNNSPETGTVLVAVGDNFESANAAVMYHARNVVHLTKAANKELNSELEALKDGVKAEWMENWYDGLGFCTWNALGQRLTEEKVLNAVDSLREHNIKITTLIIDDNWQSIDYRGEGQFQHGWSDFEAEPKAFPGGLRKLVAQIRRNNPNIEHIAVWHALVSGYWGGLDPEGSVAKTYKTIEVVREDAKRRNLPIDGKMTIVAKEDVMKFYDDFYRWLYAQGIDSVKTDAQFILDTFVSAKDRRELIREYLDAWAISSLRHFSIKAISCMSQSPQMLFHSQLPRNRPAILCRNSDDFFPEIPESHPWHIWTNAHNSLFTQHLNILPDWDMFQTVHDYSGFHAAARCISGGPIYITDVPGQHDMKLIDQMTGLTPRGKTVIFRPSVLGRSLDQYVGYDDDSLLKIGCYNGAAVTGTPIVGVFNISQRAISEILPLHRFSGCLSSMRYIVRAHSSGAITSVIDTTSKAANLVVSLGVRGYDIFTAYPISTFQSEKNGTIYVANLGLTGKMTGAAAIVANKLTMLQTGRVLVETQVKALATLGIYISRLPEMSIDEDFMAMIQGQPIPRHAVSINEQDKRVLAIDLETAWNEMGLKAGWSNEVDFKLYFNIES